MSVLAGPLTWITQSALGDALRAAGVWTYGVINLIHILGIAILFGAIVILDLRLIGWRRDISLNEIASLTVPIAATGFVVAGLSGISMLAVNGVEYIDNPFLLIKFSSIVLALLNVLVLSRLYAWRDKFEGDKTAKIQLACAGGISLFLWFITLSSGRMIGYW